MDLALSKQREVTFGTLRVYDLRQLSGRKMRVHHSSRKSLGIYGKYFLIKLRDQGARSLLREIQKRLVSSYRCIVLERSLDKSSSNLTSRLELDIQKATLRHIECAGENGLEQMVGKAALQQFRYRLMRGHECFFALLDDRIVHHSWVYYKGKRLRFPGLTDGEPLIGDCRTSEDVRGSGIYPYILEFICAYLKKQSKARATIEVRAGNEASFKGVKKAGFEEKELVTCVSCFGYPIFRHVRKLDSINREEHSRLAGLSESKQ